MCALLCSAVHYEESIEPTREHNYNCVDGKIQSQRLGLHSNS